jgi:hypothetical protein
MASFQTRVRDLAEKTGLDLRQILARIGVLEGAGNVVSVNGRTGAVTLAKSDVGLGSADNTADAAKAVLSASKLTTPRTINGVAFNGSANISIASAPYSVVTKTAGYTETITSGEILILADLAAGFTIVLPTAVGNTATITVKKVQAAGQITVDGAGAETIDGGLTAVLNNQNEAITLKSNNAGWDIT